MHVEKEFIRADKSKVKLSLQLVEVSLSSTRFKFSVATKAYRKRDWTYIDHLPSFGRKHTYADRLREERRIIMQYVTPMEMREVLDLLITKLENQGVETILEYKRNQQNDEARID